VTLLRYARLPDSQSEQWDTALVARTILYHVEQQRFDTLLTFDDYGRWVRWWW